MNRRRFFALPLGLLPVGGARVRIAETVVIPVAAAIELTIAGRRERSDVAIGEIRVDGGKVAVDDVVRELRRAMEDRDVEIIPSGSRQAASLKE